jgi:two-component system response regulator QseB
MRRQFRVLVVDDEPDILAVLRATLAAEGFDVVVAQDALAGLRAAYQHHPDAILLDVMMPKVDGFEACRRLREMTDVPIIFVTAKGTIEDIVKGLSLGADDYLVKPFDLSELAARVRALLRRRAGRAQPALEHGALKLDPSTREATLRGQPLRLSAREFALLLALLERPGAVLSREQLEERLYGWEDEVGSNAVEVHIHNLRRKLGMQAIRNVRGVGYGIGEVH